MRHFWEVMRPDVSFEVYDSFVGMRDQEDWLRDLQARAGEFDTILVPPSDDTHYEHRITYGLGRALIRHTPTTLISYSTASTGIGWIPNLFVDIAPVWERKLSALSKLDSQLSRDYFTEESLRAFHSFPQAAKKGHVLAERLRVEEGYL